MKVNEKKSMAKYSNHARMMKRQRTELILKLAQAITNVRSLDEAADLVQDLLSEQEATMLAKRIAIADALLDGHTYQTICRMHTTSMATVARVSAWLHSSGSGYELLHRRRAANAPPPGLRHDRGRTTIYNWMYHAFGELADSLDAAQRRKLETSINRLDKKSALYRELKPAFVTLLQSRH